MNTFWDYEDIFGKAKTAHLNRSMDAFLVLAGTIRRRLGKQGHLLDKYISIILEAANATLLYDAAKRGFGASELRHLCLSVMDGKADCAEHPLYGKVKESIDTHPLEYQERPTKQSLYCIALAGDFLEYAAKEYYQRQKEKKREVFDIVDLRRDLYRDIGALLGCEEELERLNLLLRQRFLIVTPMAGFLQGLTGDLLYCLTYRDAETGKLTARLLLEEQAGEPGTYPPGVERE